MKYRLSLLLLAFVLIYNLPLLPISAQDNSTQDASIYNALAWEVEVDGIINETSEETNWEGMGYITYLPNTVEEEIVYFCTISHVLFTQVTTAIEITATSLYYEDWVIELELEDFEAIDVKVEVMPEELFDPAVCADVSNTITEEQLELMIIPIRAEIDIPVADEMMLGIRMIGEQPAQLLFLSHGLHPDIGMLEAEVFYGEFCVGQSGSPVLPLQDSEDSSTSLSFIMVDGHPAILGETSRGMMGPCSPFALINIANY